MLQIVKNTFFVLIGVAFTMAFTMEITMADIKWEKAFCVFLL